MKNDPIPTRVAKMLANEKHIAYNVNTIGYHCRNYCRLYAPLECDGPVERDGSVDLKHGISDGRDGLCREANSRPPWC
jgi:hypothetical protein